MTKVCFIDIDGPMIPVRAYRLSGQSPVVDKFDPCAVALINDLIDLADAKIVISSTWGSDGYDRCADLFDVNGISSKKFHKEWVTPRRMSSSRSNEISWWLENNTDVTHYVAIDDEDLDSQLVPSAVLCDSYEGFSFRNYLECKHLLDCYVSESDRLQTLPMIQYLKKREIWRTRRSSDPLFHLTLAASELVFPPDPPSDDTN